MKPLPSFLTKDEIRALTGRIRPSAQMRQLRAQGIGFVIDGDGYPVVLRSSLEQRMSGSQAIKRSIEPDWAALRRKQ